MTEHLARAIRLEALFALYMGPCYRGAHHAARAIFARRYVNAELSAAHFAQGGSADTLAAIMAIDQQGRKK